jgi:uncharacterized protein (TIGR01319 family)
VADAPRSIIATDCGSTTTKAILIEEQGGSYRLVSRGEAPTTVEAPYEDVTAGVRNAVREIEELTGRRFLGDDGLLTPRRGQDGVDIYLSTSSAGGGLQMMVAGVVKAMTAESAQRAALGAGAIVMDTISIDDGRKPHQKIERIRSMRPDMILLSGGVDGGTITHVAELAELIAAAEPKPRLGLGFRLPIIFAGNKQARDHVQEILGGKADLRIVENLRPVLERENLGPARHEIHNLFMEHVMAQAPGYDRLMRWAGAPIMPTPGAVGLGIENVAKQYGTSVVGVDIGGATTDVFSVFQGTFNRTVSANLGMSYSMRNVLLEAGVANIMRWVPFPVEEAELRNRISNKMIRPTSVPALLEDLIIEQALAREALRLAFEHHKTLAVGLRGIRVDKGATGLFDTVNTGQTLIDLMALGMIVGSGGVLSHAPRRAQAALMMLDAFQPEGITELAVDSIFMMPQLGVLSTIHPQAAAEVFDKDCLIRLGTAIAPVGQAPGGQPLMKVRLDMPDGAREESLSMGEIKRIPLADGSRAKAELLPARNVDVGKGPGVPVTAEVKGGVVGLILDGRGRRPLGLPADTAERVRKLMEWNRAMDCYPAGALGAFGAPRRLGVSA